MPTPPTVGSDTTRLLQYISKREASSDMGPKKDLLQCVQCVCCLTSLLTTLCPLVPEVSVLIFTSIFPVVQLVSTCLSGCTGSQCLSSCVQKDDIEPTNCSDFLLNQVCNCVYIMVNSAMANNVYHISYMIVSSVVLVHMFISYR